MEMTKKDREYNVVAPLLEKYGFSLIARKDDERPDFVVRNRQGIVIGIEVTDVRIKNKPQIEATEKAIDCLLKEYSKLHQNGPHLLLTVKVNQSMIHDGILIKQVKQQLFEELDIVVMKKSKEGHLVEYYSEYPSREFCVTRMPGHFTTIKSIPIDALKETIKEKNEKLIKYSVLSQNLDLGVREYWLVINVPMQEGWDYSAFQRLKFDTGYSRIYLADPFSMKRLV